MPEEQPLQRLDMLYRVREAKFVFFIVGVVKVDYNRACFEDGQRRNLIIIDDDGDTPWIGIIHNGRGEKLWGMVWKVVPFGLRRWNQSCFCSFASRSLEKEFSRFQTRTKDDGADIRVVVHSVPYSSLSSSSMIWTFCPFGVFVVSRWIPWRPLASSTDEVLFKIQIPWHSSPHQAWYLHRLTC